MHFMENYEFDSTYMTAVNRHGNREMYKNIQIIVVDKQLKSCFVATASSPFRPQWMTIILRQLQAHEWQRRRTKSALSRRKAEGFRLRTRLWKPMAGQYKHESRVAGNYKSTWNNRMFMWGYVSSVPIFRLHIILILNLEKKTTQYKRRLYRFSSNLCFRFSTLFHLEWNLHTKKSAS